MENQIRFALDIGGTLAKVAYIDPNESRNDLCFSTPGGNIHLAKFLTSEINEVIEFLRLKHFSQSQLPVTGGGAYKFCQLIEEQLNTQVIKVDEMQSLHLGFQQVLSYATQPAYFYSKEEGFNYIQPPSTPSIVVNIGTGVSVLYVSDKIERITGTSIGGGTLLGLGQALLNVGTYEEILQLCEIGQAENCDFMLTDIYGSEVQSTLAVSLGKISIGDPSQFNKADIAKSLMNMIAYNVAQLGYLAARIKESNHIYFVGNFIKQYPYTLDRLSFGVNYWASGAIRPLFLKHDGYFGAIGALVCNLDN